MPISRATSNHRRGDWGVSCAPGNRFRVVFQQLLQPRFGVEGLRRHRHELAVLANEEQILIRHRYPTSQLVRSWTGPLVSAESRLALGVDPLSEIVTNDVRTHQNGRPARITGVFVPGFDEITA